MRLLFLILFTVNVSCFAQNFPKSELWRAEVPTVIGKVPFHILVENTKAYAINGEEKLAFDTVFVKNDSIHFKMELFEAEIVAKVSGLKMQGIYTKKLGNLKQRSGSFVATYNQNFRFNNASKNTQLNVSGKYKTEFRYGGKSMNAVGVFHQNGDKVTGTFLTTTGDYRYLEGNIVGDSLMLSNFDGTHIFLFKALIKNDSLVNGKFCSSLLNLEDWDAVKDPNAALPDANSLTFLKPGFESISFSFPDENGKMISLNDERFKNKVTIVQILGSWCPNCMDETRFLVKFKKSHKEVEIVGLAFEKSLEADFVKTKFNALRSRFGVNYPLLIAGKNSGQAASEALPMLSAVLGFPTAIVIDKKGKVREIHTGFSGPGTGIYYTQFVDDYTRLIEKLERE